MDRAQNGSNSCERRHFTPQQKVAIVKSHLVDGVAEGGWDVEQSVILARELKARGVDVIDVSSGPDSYSSHSGC